MGELAAWSPTPPPLPKSSPESITNSISCTPRELSSIGMSEKVWKKESSLKPERISPPSRRIKKRSESKPPRVRVKTRYGVIYVLFIQHTIQYFKKYSQA